MNTTSNVITLLKTIVETQKTVRTNRLVPLIKQLTKLYARQNEKIHSQQKTIEDLNKRYQRAQTKADKRLKRLNELEGK
ncbi:hypothetical protein BK128_09610 [Viridibacillus sp. FSL H7-0596]|uniref:hypothetical protein n=1 Tax=Viridibacillus sp. FSL H7-0596 TaxID=1928923 RepID=UPI00096D53FD|nr:hypothetical protein [Viridibacillus sp. FSL H7-0596]OMC86912.1 hypothetical protein BK128_09610 [Viridibacillus sp. FSL H7-0596]